MRDALVVSGAKLRSRIGRLFRRFELFAHPAALLNLTPAQIKGLDRTKAEAEARAHAHLGRVWLADHHAKYAAQLSGGEQQPVVIARTLDGSRYPAFR